MTHHDFVTGANTMARPILHVGDLLEYNHTTAMFCIAHVFARARFCVAAMVLFASCARWLRSRAKSSTVRSLRAKVKREDDGKHNDIGIAQR